MLRRSPVSEYGPHRPVYVQPSRSAFAFDPLPITFWIRASPLIAQHLKGRLPLLRHKTVFTGVAPPSTADQFIFSTLVPVMWNPSLQLHLMPSFCHPRQGHLYYLSPIWLINLNAYVIAILTWSVIFLEQCDGFSKVKQITSVLPNFKILNEAFIKDLAERQRGYQIS